MPQHAQPNSPPDADQPAHNPRAEELSRRILEFESLDDSAFGDFTKVDWLICVFGCLIIPAIVVWWFS